VPSIINTRINYTGAQRLAWELHTDHNWLLCLPRQL